MTAPTLVPARPRGSRTRRPGRTTEGRATPGIYAFLVVVLLASVFPLW